MKTFQKIKPILLSLNHKEKTHLNSSISCSGNSKTVELRKGIVKFLLTRDRTYKSFLKKFNYVSERKLNIELSRIYAILKDSIISVSSLKSEIKDSDFFLVKFKLLKQIPLVMILGKKGHVKECVNIIKKNIRKATEFELLEEKSIYLQMLLDIEYHQMPPE